MLLADADGVYDPNEYADRLLLGLTGMMSEAELHVLKGRMHQGKLNKARRGELVVAVPAGYLKQPSGQVTLDPDEQAQGVIRLIFDQFDARSTVHGVLRYMIANGVELPVRSKGGTDPGRLQWHPPCRETVRQILRHPKYAGAYRYGHRPTDPRRQAAGHPKSGRGGGLAAEDCLVFLKDRFPTYITWERFEANQQRLAANLSRGEAAGAVRGGAALLPGVVWCGRCGRRMYVRYGRAGQRAASAEAVEGWLAEQSLAALQPAALAASLTAAAEVEQRRGEQTRHWEQRLERARFEADRAGRQYHACETENRLVGRTLERMWDEALREVQRLEAEFERFTRTCPRLLGDADREQMRRLAEEVPALWHAPSTKAADRRQIARLLLERVVLIVDPESDEVAVRVEWAGDAVRERSDGPCAGTRTRRTGRGCRPDWRRCIEAGRHPRRSRRPCTRKGSGRRSGQPGSPPRW